MKVTIMNSKGEYKTVLIKESLFEDLQTFYKKDDWIKSLDRLMKHGFSLHKSKQVLTKVWGMLDLQNIQKEKMSL